MTDLNKNNSSELKEEELDQMVGGFDVGDRVKITSRMIRYCPGCGKLQMVAYGTVVAIE